MTPPARAGPPGAGLLRLKACGAVLRDEAAWAGAQAAQALGLDRLATGGTKRSVRGSPLDKAGTRLQRLEKLPESVALASYVARDARAQAMALARAELPPPAPAASSGTGSGPRSARRRLVVDLNAVGDLAASERRDFKAPARAPAPARQRPDPAVPRPGEGAGPYG